MTASTIPSHPALPTRSDAATMPKAAKIGIVTVTYNSGDVIGDFMRSLLAQDHPNFTLYVIDNISRDDTLTQVAGFADPRIVVVANPNNVGIAEGNNQGIRLALRDGCDEILLLNNDTVFPPDLLSVLTRGLEAHGCDLITPKINYFDEPQKIWCAGGYVSPWRALASLHFGINEPDQGQYGTARRVTYSPTCAMLIRASVFKRIGLMDDRYFVYFDDADFCYRANRAGLALFYTPGVLLLHKVSSLTGGDESPFTIRHMVRNRVYFIRKHAHSLFKAYCLVFCQLRYWMRLATRQDTRDIFRLRQKAFVEGLRMQVSSNDPTL